MPILGVTDNQIPVAHRTTLHHKYLWSQVPNLAHGHIDNGASWIAEHLGTRSNGSHHLQRSARSVCSFTHTSYWSRYKRTYPLSHTYLCALSRTHLIGLDINAHILSVSHASPHPLSHAPPLLPPSLSLIRMEIGRVWQG
jgi:hypothetical protein